MPTKSQRPPKGIYFEHNPRRPSAPYMLRWRDLDGASRSQSFATEELRSEAAEQLAEKRSEFGREILNFDPREWRRWLEFKTVAGDVDPMVILREWQASKAGSGYSGTKVKVGDAVKKYLEFRAEGRLSPDTLRHFDKHLRERFASHFTAANVGELTPDAVSKWIKELKHPRTGDPMDAVTKRHHRKDVNTFLGYCVAQGWIARNPCDLVPVPHVEEEDVSLLTVDEGRRLFEANAGERVVPRLALEAFGFLRASSAGRIQKEHINFDERGIRMPGAGHKSGKAKFRQGHPDNLWAWVALATDETWAMKWWEYRNEKRMAFARAKLKDSDNKLRKTCLSAHLAWKKNQPLTSYLAQHRHMSTTDIYLGVMTERDGKAWFEIMPPA